MKYNTYIAGLMSGVMVIFYISIYALNAWEIYHLPMFVLGLFAILYNLNCNKGED